MAVTFISNGYDTSTANPYTEGAWADAHPAIGQGTYGVRSPGDWKVTAVAGADRTVSIAAGRGVGNGITDKTFENETIQLDPIASGSRWDLIACRRDWTPTAGVSKFVKVNGGATAVLPGGRLYGPGNIDDQPLALVQVTAGQTQPTAIIGLRTWIGDGGGLVAEHDLVRSFLNQTGTRLWINGVDWVRRAGANDVPEWVAALTPINGGAATPITSMMNTWSRLYTSGNRAPRVWSTDGVTVHMSGIVQFKAGGGGPICVIPAAYAPADASALTYVGTVQASNGGAEPAGGATIELAIQGGVLQLVYQSKTIANDSLVPLHGTWRISG